jgi:hypothetical protein
MKMIIFSDNELCGLTGIDSNIKAISKLHAKL